MKSSKLIEGIHYTNENGRVVFTALFLIQQRKCCGNGCKNCPYDPDTVAEPDNDANGFDTEPTDPNAFEPVADCDVNAPYAAADPDAAYVADTDPDGPTTPLLLLPTYDAPKP